MAQATPIQALNAEGHIVHSFPSIASAVGAGFCASSISLALNHGKIAGDGLRWRRVGKAPITIDRLELVASRLEALAERLSR